MLDSVTDIKAERLGAGLDAVRDAFLTSDTEAVYTLSHKLAKAMAEEELVLLGYAVLRALGHGACQMTIEHALRPTHGPLPSIDDHPKVDARMWAENASQAELQAYAGACFRHMSPAAQEQFKKWVGDRVSA